MVCVYLLKSTRKITIEAVLQCPAFLLGIAVLNVAVRELLAPTDGVVGRNFERRQVTAIHGCCTIDVTGRGAGPRLLCPQQVIGCKFQGEAFVQELTHDGET